MKFLKDATLVKITRFDSSEKIKFTGIRIQLPRRTKIKIRKGHVKIHLHKLSNSGSKNFVALQAVRRRTLDLEQKQNQILLYNLCQKN